MLLASHSIYLFQSVNNLVPVTSTQPQRRAPCSLILDISLWMHSVGRCHANGDLYVHSIHTHLQGNTQELTLSYLGEVEFQGIKSVSIQGIP